MKPSLHGLATPHHRYNQWDHPDKILRDCDRPPHGRAIPATVSPNQPIAWKALDSHVGREKPREGFTRSRTLSMKQSSLANSENASADPGSLMCLWHHQRPIDPITWDSLKPVLTHAVANTSDTKGRFSHSARPVSKLLRRRATSYDGSRARFRKTTRSL